MKTDATPTFPPLESVTRPTVDTAAAAYYLNRQQQTFGACQGSCRLSHAANG
jgi:hypothetical protein